MKIDIEIRLFNSLSKYGIKQLGLQEPCTVADALDQLPIPPEEIYVALLNGKNITESLGGMVEGGHRLIDGDTLALSGPIPFSRAYGAPVV
jgi:sulfur carrier protein ThiS